MRLLGGPPGCRVEGSASLNGTELLALLTAIVTRIALLAVLDATSLPAVSTFYLSPAVGLALLFMAGVIGDLVIRLVRSRPIKDAL